MFWTLLFLAIVHRPLIIFGGPVIARMIAKAQHLDLSLKVSGSIFTNLTVSEVRAKPTGTGPSPVESIEIDSLRFDYSLWRLVREGVGWFIKSYEIHHADLRFVALPSKTEEERESKKTIAQTLRTVLTQPAAYSDRVLINDFNLRVTSPKAVTEVLGLNLLLHPEDPGYMKIARIQVPGLPTWENLQAETSYVGRNLFQRNLRLTQDLLIEEINFDASRRVEGIGTISLKAQAFGGHADVSLIGKEIRGEGRHLPNRYETRLKMSVRDVGVRAAAKYFGGGDIPFDRLGQLEVDFDGDPELPRTWEGTVDVRVDDLSAGGLKIPEIGAHLQFNKGTALVTSELEIGQNHIGAEVKVGLPPGIAEWVESDVDGTFTINAPALNEIVSSFTTMSSGGSLTSKGTIAIHSKAASVSMDVTARNAWFDRLVIDSADVRLTGSRPIDPNEKRPLAGVKADVKLTSAQLKAGTFTIDSAQVDATVNGGQVSVRQLLVKRGTNYVYAKVEAQLPDDLSKTELITGTTTLDVQVPALAEFGIAAGDHIVGGNLQTKANIAAAGGKFNGDITINGGDFSLGDFKTGPLVGNVKLTGDSVEIQDLSLVFSGNDRLLVHGRGAINAPHAYEGDLQLGFRDLAELQPLLTAFKVKERVRGSLNVKWNGDGVAKEGKHRGATNVELRSVHYGELRIDEALLGGTYGSNDANARLQVVIGPTRLSTQILWVEQMVRLRDIELMQGNQRALTGEMSLSLETTPEQPFDALRQQLRVSLRADRLDIERLLTSLGRPAPAVGQITMALAVAGTAVRPEIEMSLEGRGLRARAAQQFDPAEADVRLNYRPGALSLNAVVRQRLIQPLTVTANAPLDIEQVITTKQLPRDLPINASVRMPSTSLAVLSTLSPEIRRIDGNASVDVTVRGTVEKPALSGVALVTLRSARMTNESIPSIGQFDARLVFADDTLRFERFRGEVGGGTFDLGGTVRLASLDNPAFDLRLQAREVLVRRDDSITIRSDADVRIGGTLKSGTATGEIAIVQSRFFREIDILPIGLPGRPRPAPRTVRTEPTVVLPPPLDNWRIDLRIVTRQNDPFLIRGNVANGSVSMDLRLGNTGSQPWLDGSVTIDKFTGNLPFSVLTVENGHVYFTRNNPLIPILDIQAQSRTRNYTVTAFVFGNAYQPQVSFSSEPPLSHADIVSLLATGATTADLSGNAGVLASKAAFLAAQTIWRKIFKPKKKAVASSIRRDGQGAAGFLDRFDLELGATDAATGAQAATTTIRINEQLYILGELDVQGRYTGSLKYLLRFR